MSQFFVQDATEKQEYQVDWADTLPDGQTIANSTWASVPSGLTLSGQSVDGLFTVTDVTGGINGKRYQITNTVVSSNGETYVDSIFIYMEKK